MKKQSVALMMSTSLLAGSATAGTMGPAIQPQSSWAWVGAISAGPVWAKGGKTQTVFHDVDTEKTYVAKPSTETLFNGEVFLGLQKTLTRMIKSQLGLAVGYNSPMYLKQDIWDGNSVEYYNYTSHYKIQHTHLALKSKLLLDAGYWLTPWISGSVGLGFNRSYGFHNTPLMFEALPVTDFPSHTQTAFTYTLGAGVQKALNKHWQVGVGYEFADWGKSGLGPVAGQPHNSRLGLNHLYTNGVLLNLTFTI